MGRLEEKVALIFGGGSGIGFETAKCLAAEGAAVVISSRREEKNREAVEEIQRLGGRAAFISGDYTVPAFIDTVFDFTVRTFGIPDITVNSAGTGMPGDWLGGVVFEEMERLMKVNVIAPYIVMQKAAGLLQDAGKPGKIMNIGSFRSHYTGKDGNGPIYASSKAAIGWLTESTARVLHKPGNQIAVTLICPGAVNTEMHDGYHDNYMDASTVAQCVLSAACMPDNATVFDMTMLCTQQNPW